MAEESESTSGSLKNILIGLAGTVTLAIGTYVTKLITGEDEAATPAAVSAPAPVINITNANTQQQSAGGKTVIIKEKEAAPAKPKAKTAKEELEKDPQW